MDTEIARRSYHRNVALALASYIDQGKAYHLRSEGGEDGSLRIILEIAEPNALRVATEELNAEAGSAPPEDLAEHSRGDD